METKEFCRSLDFMKLGQAIHHKNWQVAASVLQRLQKQSMEMGDDIFGRNFTALRQCLLHKDQIAAKNALAIIIAKRTKILNSREGIE